MGFGEETLLEESQLEIRRAEVEGRVGELKNGEATGKDEITGELIKGGGDKVVNWIWRLCNTAFESGDLL